MYCFPVVLWSPENVLSWPPSAKDASRTPHPELLLIQFVVNKTTYIQHLTFYKFRNRQLKTEQELGYNSRYLVLPGLTRQRIAGWA
jgi:hypothetical protein